MLTLVRWEGQCMTLGLVTQFQTFGSSEKNRTPIPIPAKILELIPIPVFLRRTEKTTKWNILVAMVKFHFGQVSDWQSVTLLPISCKSVQPVPARVEEPVSPARPSSSGGVTNNPPFPKMP